MIETGNNRRAIEDADSEIRQRRGRNFYLMEYIPTREKYIRYCEALVRNKSKANAEAMLEAAKWRLERTKASIVENEEAIAELEKAARVLTESNETRKKDSSVRYTPVTNQEFIAREVVIRKYTRSNGVVKKSHIKYGYNL